MKTVLLPYDDSQPAKNALQYLIEQARDYPQLVVHVLNVQPQPRLYGGDVSLAHVLPQLEKDTLTYSGEIAEAAAKVLQQAGVEHHAHAAVGDVISIINRLIKEQDCDAVVMGTRGMGGLGNLFLGSVATQVIHSVTVPVTLVK